MGICWLSVSEIAPFLAFNRDAVYMWIEGTGFSDPKIGRCWKSKVAEIDEQVKSGSGASEEPTK